MEGSGGEGESQREKGVGEGGESDRLRARQRKREKENRKVDSLDFLSFGWWKESPATTRPTKNREMKGKKRKSCSHWSQI